MNIQDEILAFQRVADYRAVGKIVRSSGAVSIIFGLIAIAVGYFGIQANPINALLLLLGILMVGTGIWNCANPTPIGIIVDGITLIVLGLWNLAVLILNMMVLSMTSSQTPSLPIYGAFQIVFGAISLSRYSRFARAYDIRPTSEWLKHVDEMLKALWKSKVKISPNLIEFTVSNQGTRMIPWRGELFQDRAVFGTKTGQDAAIAIKRDVEITEGAKVVLGKAIKVSVRIGTRVLNGAMPPESLARYNAWKRQPEPTPTPPPGYAPQLQSLNPYS